MKLLKVLLDVILVVGCIVVFPLFWLTAYICHIFSTKRSPQHGLAPTSTFKIAFFHPYCNDGGGGERVLWSMIQAIQQTYPNSRVSIYSGKEYIFDAIGKREMTGPEILAKATSRFNISFVRPSDIKFYFLEKRHLVESSRYPRFTLLLQSLSVLPLVVEALSHHKPDIFVDTMGFPFSYPLVKLLAGCKVMAYVHYPTISTDMLQAVAKGRPNTVHNHVDQSALSGVKTQAKIIYYRIFSLMYGSVCLFADGLMCNSSWTFEHVKSLAWGCAERLSIVFPPCDTLSMQALPLSPRKPNIISVGQFRPEKDHMLQIRAFELFLERFPTLTDGVQLLIVGSCRHNNQSDVERLRHLQDYCRQRGMEKRVEFHAGVSHPKLVELLGSSTCGIHTMWNEHFGIGVVEFMAAGLVTIAHNSGGPKSDILTPHDGQIVGFLAETAEEYCEAIAKVFQFSAEERQRIGNRARRAAIEKFSEKVFQDRVIRLFSHS
eukprot:TRINITY_DN1396_c0_g1_i2.p1 TRINITY_DN1396_c0_g1~~TRINITY_DN1396_c0_g1_i2.p1  ORF type:complete len:489 (-),score=51.99 TRINITY_DN1396_c0_g1_i2:1896-3362(-)